jgi:hypothetical protein
VQLIDGDLEESALPSTSDERRVMLEWEVQLYQSHIKRCKSEQLSCEAEIAEERKALSSKQGEPVELLCR